MSQTSDRVIVTVPVERDSSTGALPVNFGWDYEDGTLPSDTVTFSPFTFPAGSTEGFVTVSLNKSVVYNDSNTLYLYIAPSDKYVAGYFDQFDIFLNQY